MARFFFDIRLGAREAVDDEGVELPSAEAACREAQAALPEIADDGPPTLESETLVLTVRDASGALVYRGETLTHLTTQARLAAYGRSKG